MNLKQFREKYGIKGPRVIASMAIHHGGDTNISVAEEMLGDLEDMLRDSHERWWTYGTVGVKLDTSRLDLGADTRPVGMVTEWRPNDFRWPAGDDDGIRGWCTVQLLGDATESPDGFMVDVTIDAVKEHCRPLPDDEAKSYRWLTEVPR